MLSSSFKKAESMPKSKISNAKIGNQLEFGFLLTVLLLFSSPFRAFSSDFFVSADGNDLNPGTKDQPFKTMGRAVTAAFPGDTVYLRNGAYRETLTPIRSGTPNAPILFTSFPGEKAVLCGTDLVTGPWKSFKGNIYQLDGAPPTWALFVDGHLMHEARWPNAPMDNFFSGYATTGAGTTPDKILDPHLPDGDLNGARVHIIPGAAYVSFTRAVTNYGSGGFGFDKPLKPLPAYQVKSGNLYYLYGSLSLLNAEGEWYQDAGTGRIYLWAPNGDSPAGHQVEIAARKRVVDDAAQSYIQIKNLFTFSGGICFNQCTGCRVEGVNQKYVEHYTEVEGYKAEENQNGFLGGSACTWTNGSIQYSAGNGIFLNGTGHTVSNMVISEADYIGTYFGNIQCEGSGHHIEGNTFFDSGRYLIWHDQTKGCFIRHNELYNGGLITNDVGATYAYFADGAGTEISYNYVHDIHVPGGVGIYLDNNTSNFLVHHNLVKNCSHSGITLNLASLNNQVYNNTIVDCGVWTDYWGSKQVSTSMAGTSIVNNLGVGTGTFRYLSGPNAPLFLNNGPYVPENFVPGTYQLATGSGAIDQGLAIPGITDGYAGKAPDVGAYEYGTVPWSAGATLVVPTFPYP
jgi:hypothetical protein